MTVVDCEFTARPNPLCGRPEPNMLFFFFLPIMLLEMLNFFTDYVCKRTRNDNIEFHKKQEMTIY